MQPEMIGRLERLRQRAEESGRLASEAHTTAPESTEGLDASGCVRIVLGPDRLPLRIHIRDRWQDRLDAGSLADAVMDANNDAVRSAYRIWSDRLDDTGWWRRQRAAEETPERRTMPAASPPLTPRARHVPEDPEMGERILRLLHDTRRNASQPEPADGTGSNDSGTVSILLSLGGLAGCVIDEGWARHRHGDDLAAALSHALRQARRRLASPRPGLREAGALIGEALAALAAFAGTGPSGDYER
jgi:DNA-binding protein YbaB